MTAEISEHRVAVRETVLNVAEAGSGPAVVLLHGFPHTWQVWLPVMDRLAQDQRVIAPDLRGLGASDRPARAYDAGQVAADVVALLDARGVERADLVGLDLGAPPALLAAMTRPERVRRLVVMRRSARRAAAPDRRRPAVAPDRRLRAHRPAGRPARAARAARALPGAVSRARYRSPGSGAGGHVRQEQDPGSCERASLPRFSGRARRG